MVKHPILFMCFARPEYARPVFEAIKKAKPSTLYFYCNKARENNNDETRRNEEVRSLVQEVDWDCDLHTWLRDEYVDLYTSLLGAKNWAFENEETLIMLEEDCLASQAFFQYCDHFLDIYKDNKCIGYLTGDNYTNGLDACGADHFITHSSHHHGWATWKDRWNLVDYYGDIDQLMNFKAIRKYYGNDNYLGWYYCWLFNKLTPFIKHTRCWDYIHTLYQIKYNMRVVAPVWNLVQNVGRDGTHVKNAKGIAFDMENGENKGDYPINGKSVQLIANEKYLYLESSEENIRGWWHLIHIVTSGFVRNAIKRIIRIK